MNTWTIAAAQDDSSTAETAAFVRELAAYLEAARHDPSRRFRQRPET